MHHIAYWCQWKHKRWVIDSSRPRTKLGLISSLDNPAPFLMHLSLVGHVPVSFPLCRQWRKLLHSQPKTLFLLIPWNTTATQKCSPELLWNICEISEKCSSLWAEALLTWKMSLCVNPSSLIQVKWTPHGHGSWSGNILSCKGSNCLQHPSLLYYPNSSTEGGEWLHCVVDSASLISSQCVEQRGAKAGFYG